MITLKSSWYLVLQTIVGQNHGLYYSIPIYISIIYICNIDFELTLTY